MRYRQNSKHSWSVKFVGFIFSTKTNEESVSKQLTPSDTEVITAAVLTRSGRMVEIIQRNQFWLSPRVKDHHFFWMCFWSCSYFPHTHNVCFVTVKMSSQLKNAVKATAPTDRVTLRFLITACLRWEICMMHPYRILTFWLISQVSHLCIRNNSSCYCWQMPSSLSPESRVGAKHQNVY